jgi:hypothetical protein
MLNTRLQPSIGLMTIPAVARDAIKPPTIFQDTLAGFRIGSEREFGNGLPGAHKGFGRSSKRAPIMHRVV